eukprot:2317814-Rhodomonas_salina.1
MGEPAAARAGPDAVSLSRPQTDKALRTLLCGSRVLGALWGWGLSVGNSLLGGACSGACVVRVQGTGGRVDFARERESMS